MTHAQPDYTGTMSDVVQLMRDISRQTDPQELVRVYRSRAGSLVSWDAVVAISRRDVDRPHFRVTRFTGWKDDINPWTQKDRLPLLKGGLFGDLIYGDEPAIIDHLDVPESDPAFPYVQGYKSLFAMPSYDQGVAMNMTLALKREPAGFDRRTAPQTLWMSNLFGRATQGLVLSSELRRAYDLVDRELRVVSEIQRSLLPVQLPQVPGLQLACHYQPSKQAGGDYYDFFQLPDGNLGMLIADVSGHGTPAAVLMAVTHTIAHDYPGPPSPPGSMMRHLNEKLFDAYQRTGNGFVTAFYAIYNPRTREISYTSAGHNPPRIRRTGRQFIEPADGAADLPLGVDRDTAYSEARTTLDPGDTLVMYTDGITEARNGVGEFYGDDRLDRAILDAPLVADQIVARVLRSVQEFAGTRPADDDRTLVVAQAN